MAGMLFPRDESGAVPSRQRGTTAQGREYADLDVDQSQFVEVIVRSAPTGVHDSGRVGDYQGTRVSNHPENGRWYQREWKADEGRQPASLAHEMVNDCSEVKGREHHVDTDGRHDGECGRDKIKRAPIVHGWLAQAIQHLSKRDHHQCNVGPGVRGGTCFEAWSELVANVSNFGVGVGNGFECRANGIYMR